VLNAKILPPEFKKEFKKLTPAQDEHPIHKSLQESLSDCEEQLMKFGIVRGEG
jgi:hypothetical protein